MKQIASVKYSTAILDRKGNVIRERAPKRNLILNTGLNLVGTVPWANCFAYCAVGTGTTPVKRDSGAVTFSRAGTTVTASAGFFEAADAGRLLKFDSGEEVTIASFTSSTSVETSSSGAIASAQGTIWYVNETGHQTEAQRTNTELIGTGERGVSYAAGVMTTWRTFLFPEEVGAVVYKEIGWSNAGAGNLFGRDLIPGGGDALGAGQQYKVKVELSITLSPIAQVSIGALNTGGAAFDTSGNAIIDSLGLSQNNTNISLSHVRSSGVIIGGPLEPSESTNGGVARLATETFTLETNTTSGRRTFLGTATPTKAFTVQPYTNGNHYRDKVVTFAVTEANTATAHGILIESNGGTLSYALKFNAVQAKTSDHSLSLTFRNSWGRELVN